jgi:CHAT domain-containing protein
VQGLPAAPHYHLGMGAPLAVGGWLWPAGRVLPGWPATMTGTAGTAAGAAPLLTGLRGLAADVGDRITELAAGRQAAGRLGAVVKPDAVAAVQDLISQALRQDRHVDAAVLSDLLHAAVTGAVASAAAGPDLGRETGLGLLAVAPLVIAEVPDGRWQRHLDQVAQDLVAAAFRSGDAERIGTALLRAALATLIAYTQGKTTQHYADDLAVWQVRMGRVLGHELADHRDPAVLMPDPAEALRRAVTRAGAAARVLPGFGRGLALLAEAYAELFGAILAEPGGEPPARSLAEAAELLAADPDEAAQVLLADARAAAGQGSMALPGGLDEGRLAAALGNAGALAVLARAAQVNWRAGDLGAARPLAAAAAALAQQHGTAADRRLAWTMTLHVGDTAVACRGPLAAIEAAAAALADLAPAARRGAALAHLAAHAGPKAGAVAVLALLQEAAELAPDLTAGPAGAALDFLRAAWLQRQGEVCGAGGQHAEAVRAAAAAAAGYADLDLPDLAIVSLTGVIRHAAADLPAAEAAVEAVAGLMPYLAVAAGEEAIGELLDVLRGALGYLADAEEVNGQLLFAAYQLAKGLWFGAERSERLPDPDPVAAPVGSDLAWAELGSFDSEEHTCACARAEEMLPGRTAAQIAVNRQRAFDRKLAAAQHQRAAFRVAGSALTRLDHVQEHLGRRSVLVSCYLGGIASSDIAGSGQITAFTDILTVTAQVIERMGITTPNQAGFVDLQDGLQTLRLHHIALNVAQLRRELTEDPQFRPLTRECERTLAEETGIYLGSVADALSSWRAAGHDHLVIWPHGPLHVLPYHLLGTPPLADDWIVTTVPEVRTLGAPPAPVAPGAMLCVGVPDGGADFGYPAEEAVARQAADIAALLGGQLLTGRDATRAALRAALPGCRYLHLAAHGTLNAAAPSLGCLYLMPGSGADGDGRLFAYELARLDLRGVDLVTLSACESALSRADIADNLVGIPAAALRAGARTVIGCLWPVAPGPAAVFFTSLYQQIAGNAGKLDAYRAAQQETRARYPRYRDWGAFCYLGEWRRPAGE